MDTQQIIKKIGLDGDTLSAIIGDMASEPDLRDRSPEALRTLLFEVLGVLTGDSPRHEFPRTEIDRKVFKIARTKLEPPRVNMFTQRLAWQSLWFSTRQLTAAT